MYLLLARSRHAPLESLSLELLFRNRLLLTSRKHPLSVEIHCNMADKEENHEADNDKKDGQGWVEASWGGLSQKPRGKTAKKTI